MRSSAPSRHAAGVHYSREIRCHTWTVANFLPDAHSNPGKPHRDVDHPLGMPYGGSVPEPVLEANAESDHAVAIA